MPLVSLIHHDLGIWPYIVFQVRSALSGPPYDCTFTTIHVQSGRSVVGNPPCLSGLFPFLEFLVN
jgi:hypothetical protein